MGLSECDSIDSVRGCDNEPTAELTVGACCDNKKRICSCVMIFSDSNTFSARSRENSVLCCKTRKNMANKYRIHAKWGAEAIVHKLVASAHALKDRYCRAQLPTTASPWRAHVMCAFHACGSASQRQSFSRTLEIKLTQALSGPLHQAMIMSIYL